MKIDNFTTARCNICGWLKQFHPGREFNYKDFKCNCKEEEIKEEAVKPSRGRPNANSNRPNKKN